MVKDFNNKRLKMKVAKARRERQQKESDSHRLVESTEEVVEAPKGEKWRVYLKFDDPSGQGVASVHKTVHAPDRDAAKSYAAKDLSKNGRRNVKAMSARRAHQVNEIKGRFAKSDSRKNAERKASKEMKFRQVWQRFTEIAPDMIAGGSDPLFNLIGSGFFNKYGINEDDVLAFLNKGAKLAGYKNVDDYYASLAADGLDNAQHLVPESEKITIPKPKVRKAPGKKSVAHTDKKKRDKSGYKKHKRDITEDHLTDLIPEIESRLGELFGDVPLEITGYHDPSTDNTGWPKQDHYTFSFEYDGLDGKGHKGAAHVNFERRGLDGKTIEDFEIINYSGTKYMDHKNFRFSLDEAEPTKVTKLKRRWTDNKHKNWFPTASNSVEPEFTPPYDEPAPLPHSEKNPHPDGPTVRIIRPGKGGFQPSDKRPLAFNDRLDAVNRRFGLNISPDEIRNRGTIPVDKNTVIKYIEEDPAINFKDYDDGRETPDIKHDGEFMDGVALEIKALKDAPKLYMARGDVQTFYPIDNDTYETSNGMQVDWDYLSHLMNRRILDFEVPADYDPGVDADNHVPHDDVDPADTLTAEAKKDQVKHKGKKAKKVKPTRGHESPHPYRGGLVGEGNKINRLSSPSKKMVDEGPLTMHNVSQLADMAKVAMSAYIEQHANEPEELKRLLQAIGKDVDFDDAHHAVTIDDKGHKRDW